MKTNGSISTLFVKTGFQAPSVLLSTLDVFAKGKGATVTIDVPQETDNGEVSFFMFTTTCSRPTKS